MKCSDCLTGFLMSLVAAQVAADAPAYVSSLLEIEETIDHYQTADVNGDGRRDLLVGVWSEERGRELFVYHQKETGRFNTDRRQLIELKRDIIAYGTADVRDAPGDELIFVSRSGAFSYSTHKNSYAGNIKPLLQWRFVNSLANRNRILRLQHLADYNNDDRVDMLLPGPEGFGLFYGANQESFVPGPVLPEPYTNQEKSRPRVRMDFSTERGLEFHIDNESPFASLIEDPANHAQEEIAISSRGSNGTASILRLNTWTAAVYPASLNDDNLTDFVFVDDSETDPDEHRRLNLVYQTGSEPGIDVKQMDVPNRSGLFLSDFTGDGLTDFYSVDLKGGDQASVYFYRNRDGDFDPEKPDQVMRFSGFDVTVEFERLNGDDRPALVVSYYSLSAVEAVRNGNMLRTTLIYPAVQSGGEDKVLFANRPASRHEEKYSASEFKGLVQRMAFSADIDGDGLPDAVAVNNDGALVGHKVEQDYGIGATPFWRFNPRQIVGRFTPVSLNRDNSSDFVLQHQHALTILVSQP